MEQHILISVVAAVARVERMRSCLPAGVRDSSLVRATLSRMAASKP